MKKIALLFIGGLIVSSAFQQGYAEASKREASARVVKTAPAAPLASVAPPPAAR